MRGNCDTCARKLSVTRDIVGLRTVKCDRDGRRVLVPFAHDCEHWEKALGEK